TRSHSMPRAITSSSCGEETSHCSNSTSPAFPSAAASVATFAPASPLMSIEKTRAPSRANERTDAAPIPLAPPVTTMRRPSRIPIGSASPRRVSVHLLDVFLQPRIRVDHRLETLTRLTTLAREVLGREQAFVRRVLREHVLRHRHAMHFVGAVHDAHHRRGGPHALERREV